MDVHNRNAAQISQWTSTALIIISLSLSIGLLVEFATDTVWTNTYWSEGKSGLNLVRTRSGVGALITKRSDQHVPFEKAGSATGNVFLISNRGMLMRNRTTTIQHILRQVVVTTKPHTAELKTTSMPGIKPVSLGAVPSIGSQVTLVGKGQCTAMKVLDAYPESAACCAERILREPKGRCSHKFMHWADGQPKGCSCVQPGQECISKNLSGDHGNVRTYSIEDKRAHLPPLIVEVDLSLEDDRHYGCRNTYHACVRLDKNTPTTTVWALHNLSDVGCSVFKAVNWNWIPSEVVSARSISEASKVFIDDNITVVPIYHYFGTNPQHCMSDIVIPLLLALGGSWSPGVKPRMGKYVMPGNRAIYAKGYCLQLLQFLGIIGDDDEEVRLSKTVWTCAPKFSVPRRGTYRHPSWVSTRVTQKEWFDIDWSSDGMGDPLRRFSEKLWDTDNLSPFWSYMHNLARSRITCLSGDPVGKGKLPEAINGQSYVLFYDRGDTNRRHVGNADSIYSEIRNFYGARIPVVRITSFVDYSVCQQATIYSKARVLVTPHGGSTANTIFMPKGAQVIEIFCGKSNQTTPSISSSGYAKLIGLNYSVVFEPSCIGKVGFYMWVSHFNITRNIVSKYLTTSVTGPIDSQQD